MKFLLINPPTPEVISNKEYYVPPNMLYLAAVLQKTGVEVNILDLNILRLHESQNIKEAYDKAVIERVSDFRPSMIGLGCLFSGQFPDALRFSEKIKDAFPAIPIVMGGIHATLYHKEILTNCRSIDWIVLGEGETAITQLAAMHRTGRYEFDRIDGFAYKVGRTIAVNPKRNFISDLDALPFPAYHLINLEDYYHDTSNWHNPRGLPINASLPLLSSRSCPMRCNFCSMFMVMGPKWRSRSPKNVVDEIQFLYDEYGHSHFSFMDDNLTLNKRNTLELCNEIIRRNLNIQFETPNGVATRTFDADVLDALVTAGLVRISFAIESGSDFIRNRIMGKHLPLEKIYEVVQLTKKYPELYVRAFFIMGLPEETRETLEDTYRLIEEIDVDKPIVSNLIPFPGTKLFEQALRDDLFVDNLDVDNLWKNPSFYFTENKRFFIKPYNLDLTDLHEYRSKFDELIERCISEKMRVRVG
ncbi:MAG: B12-binding domain-containing radical SAM protein [Sedimentisphaerales bacterium]|nr:B12-binding domain-containing radical SAM protein [Sedimentisphaerales bacterium]